MASAVAGTHPVDRGPRVPDHARHPEHRRRRPADRPPPLRTGCHRHTPGHVRWWRSGRATVSWRSRRNHQRLRGATMKEDVDLSDGGDSECWRTSLSRGITFARFRVDGSALGDLSAKGSDHSKAEDSERDERHIRYSVSQPVANGSATQLPKRSRGGRSTSASSGYGCGVTRPRR